MEAEKPMKRPSYLEPEYQTAPGVSTWGREVRLPGGYLMTILFATAGATFGRWMTSTPSWYVALLRNSHITSRCL
jgi:hypothetical protein